MNTTRLRTSTLVMAACAALSLAACDRSDERTVGEKVDATVAKTEQAAADAKSTMQQEAADVKAEASAAADRAKAAIADGSAKTGSAIERTAEKIGDKVGDAGITAGVNAELARDASLSAMRINVDTSNGHVSLRGTAPSSLARDRATTLAKSVKGVVSVDNQLEVRG